MLIVYSQEQKNHTKKMYRSEDGKLYINKALPMYIWVSTSPDAGSEKIKLESEDSKAYTNPMYFDTDGYNTFRSPSKVDTVTKKMVYPEEDIIFEVYADADAPHVRISIDSTKLYKATDKTFCSGQSYINIITKDDFSGVEKVYYSVNGVAFSDYKDALSLAEEKEYTIKAYAVDNCGNASTTNERIFTIDKTAPVTKVEISEDQSESTVSGRSVIKLNADDNASGVRMVKYTIDGGVETLYKGGIYCKYLNEGDHTITYYGEDNVGNKEAVKSYTFYIDKTAPLIVDEFLGDTYIVNGQEYTSGRSKMKLTAMDNKAGVKEIYFSTNGVDYNLYTEPFYLPNNKGNQVLKYYAVDKVNNSNQNANISSGKQRISYMDLSGPVLKNTYIGKIFKNRDTVFINKDTKIKLIATDLESGLSKISYAINGKTEQTYNEPFSIDKEGVYNIQFSAFDNVMNSNKKDFYCIVDTKGPIVEHKFSIEPIEKKAGKAVYPAHTVVFLTAIDAQSGFDKFYYSINGGPLLLYTGFIKDLQRNSKYKIKVKAYDTLGNSSEEEFEFMTSD